MVLWVALRDIPYGFMGGVEEIYLTVLWVGVRDTLWFYG